MLSLALFIFSGASASENPDELYRQGRFADAEKIYTELDMDNPRDVRFRYNRGCAAFQNSDFQGALAAFSSVLKRTEDRKIRDRTLYNLGNTAFKLGDFESAADYYRQTIENDPDNKDAAYNLELSLREIERLRQKEKGRDQEQEAGEDRQGKDEKTTGADERAGDTDRGDKGDKDRLQEPKQPEGNKKGGETEEQEDKGDSGKDLSGDLTPMGGMGEKDEGNETSRSGSSLDRKKAEAMLDNVHEDRSRFLRFQAPKDKRQGVASGKEW